MLIVVVSVRRFIALKARNIPARAESPGKQKTRTIIQSPEGAEYKFGNHTNNFYQIQLHVIFKNP